MQTSFLFQSLAYRVRRQGAVVLLRFSRRLLVGALALHHQRMISRRGLSLALATLARLQGLATNLLLWPNRCVRENGDDR